MFVILTLHNADFPFSSFTPSKILQQGCPIYGPWRCLIRLAHFNQTLHNFIWDVMKQEKNTMFWPERLDIMSSVALRHEKVEHHCLTFRNNKTIKATYLIRIWKTTWTRKICKVPSIVAIEVYNVKDILPTVLNIPVLPPHITVLSNFLIVWLLEWKKKKGFSLAIFYHENLTCCNKFWKFVRLFVILRNIFNYMENTIQTA